MQCYHGRCARGLAGAASLLSRVWRNPQNILTHLGCVLSLACSLWGGCCVDVGPPCCLFSLKCLFLPCSRKLWSNPSTAGNRPQASRPQGLLNHPRCLLLWQFPWLTPTSDTLAVVSPRLSGGGFPGGFESLVCWCFVAFKWPFSIFHVEVQCLIRERLSTGKSCGFGEPGFLVPLS